MKVGIDIGGSHIGIGIVDNENKLIKKYEKDFYEWEKEKIIFVIEEYIKDMLNAIKEDYEIEMIGVAIPGTTKDGIILKTVNLKIVNYDITYFLKTIIDVPVVVRNDGKCAILAEFDNLCKKDEKMKNANILFLNIGTGIGGGVIYEGKLLKGHEYEGFEMGHMIVKAGGLQCKCGKRGCFEKYGSILEHKNRIKNRLNIDENINGDELRKIMYDREKEIEDLNEEYVSDLALGISNLINIFEPDTIVIGGGFTHFKDMFMKKIEERLLNSEYLFNRRDNLDFRIAELGNDAGIIGSTM